MNDPHKGMKHTGPNRAPRPVDGKVLKDKKLEAQLKPFVGSIVPIEQVKEVNGLVGHHNKHKLGRTLPFVRKDGTWYD